MTPVEPGPRHTTHAPRVMPTIWKCPSCKAENQSVIGTPCVHCGAGQLGQRVEDRTPTMPVQERIAEGYLKEAFSGWIKPLLDRVEPEQAMLLFEAFKAGYEIAKLELPSATVDQPVLSGTAESRTICAALKLFVDQVLTYAKDEVASGEFLSVPQTQALISQYER